MSRDPDDRSFNVTLEGAGGMTHDQVGDVTKTLRQRGIDMHNVRSLIFDQREGWVGVVFRDGREAVVTDVIEIPGGRRKVFLPGVAPPAGTNLH